MQLLQLLQLGFQALILIDKLFELQCLLISTLDLAFLTVFEQLILETLVLVGKLLDFLFECGQLFSFGFEHLLSGCKIFNLVFFLFVSQGRQLLLINVNKLINIMQFFLNQLELLFQIRRMRMGLRRDFHLIKNLIDSFAQFIKLISVLLVLYFKINDISLVILFRLPLLIQKVGSVLD
jgi:hypothetical protein